MPSELMARLNRGGSSIEISYLVNLTNDKNKIVKKNVRGKSVVALDDIKIVDYYFDNAGKLDETKCRILHENYGWVILTESYEEISKLKMDGLTVEVKGFTQQPKKEIKKVTNKKINTKTNGRTTKRSTRKNA